LRDPARSVRGTRRLGVAVATFWLVRRLPEFRALQPGLHIHIVASDRRFGAVADHVDAGIAYGNGNWPGFTATLLRRGMVFPVCSPAYLRGRRGRLRRIEQLREETLLSREDDRAGLLDWPAWFAQMNVTGYSGRGSLRFNSHPLLLQAACQGQGIALGWSLLVEDLLAAGTLIRPLDVELESPYAFYFVCPEKNVGPGALALRAWLVGKFSSEGVVS